MSEPTPQSASRRDFLKTAAVAGTTLATVAVPLVHAAGSDVLRVGLVGCGGRGTEAAMQALRADKNTRLVALGDTFTDRLEYSLGSLKKHEDIAGRITVDADHSFVGFNAYKSVIENVDVVLLATPPGFRPIHLRAAIDAGKHVFCEKPMAVDGPGVRKVLDAAAEARKKNLSLMSGFCWRRHPIMRQTMKRVHDGDLGDILTMQCNYNTGPIWVRKREKGMSDMEHQMRNWYYYAWLSGDFNVEQHIHSLDKAAWAMKDVYPVRAVGLGGRQVRTGAEFGHIFDHHAVVYEYENGTRLFSFCRQQAGCAPDVSDHFWGTQGTCHVVASFPPRVDIGGKAAWKSNRKDDGDMYQIEHNELFASIRSGKPINDGEWMARSTLMGIMGRLATYTGQVITWENALNSMDLSPKVYDMNASLPEPKVALPGVTKLA